MVSSKLEQLETLICLQTSTAERDWTRIQGPVLILPLPYMEVTALESHNAKALDFGHKMLPALYDLL